MSLHWLLNSSEFIKLPNVLGSVQVRKVYINSTCCYSLVIGSHGSKVRVISLHSESSKQCWAKENGPRGLDISPPLLSCILFVERDGDSLELTKSEPEKFWKQMVSVIASRKRALFGKREVES